MGARNCTGVNFEVFLEEKPVNGLTRMHRYHEGAPA